MHTTTHARAESRRRPTLPRGLGLVAVGLVVLTGVVVLPAFALENEPADVAPSSQRNDRDGTDDPPTTTSTTTSTTATTLSPEAALEQQLAAMTDDERRAWELFTMNPEQRDAFGRFLAPPSPETRSAPAAPAGVWDQLAYCEAGGNWAHAPVGSHGYSGGLMFLPSTWRAYGGGEFAPEAYQASREAQIVVAERIRSGHGGSYRAWPGCRAKLGLA
jgi:hypothetical protein